MTTEISKIRLAENFQDETEVGTAKVSFASVMYAAYIRHQTSSEGIRRGQAWMNALAEVDFDLYAEVTGTEADCFYNDNKIDAFKQRVFRTGD